MYNGTFSNPLWTKNTLCTEQQATRAVLIWFRNDVTDDFVELKIYTFYLTCNQLYRNPYISLLEVIILVTNKFLVKNNFINFIRKIVLLGS